MEKRKLIFDCDPGHDDIMAIMNALAHPEAFEILGYTTVCGNNYVDKITDNLCRVLTALHMDGRVAVGYDAPLVLQPDPQPGAHGENGLGGPVLPKPTVVPIRAHAVEFLRDMAMEHDRITIVAMAPLTNIAVFLKTWPQLKEKIACITLMGGSRAGGNILPRAEFNIYEDPHAAKIVFESGVPIVMSDIEICNECATPHTLIDGLKGKGKVQDLAHDILQFFSLYNRKRNVPCSPVFDLVPVMHLLHPELFEEQKCSVKIELAGAYTQGMTVVEEVPEEGESAETGAAVAASEKSAEAASISTVSEKSAETASISTVSEKLGANVTLLAHCRDNAAYNRYFTENLELLEQMTREREKVEVSLPEQQKMIREWEKDLM